MWYKILVYDCETTWIFSRQEKNLDKLPYCVQFWWILVEMEEDGTYKEEKRIDRLIKPPIPIPYVTSVVHNIYDGDVIDKEPFDAFAEELSELINSADIIAGHNIAFDNWMMKIEFERLKLKGLTYDFVPKGIICTMHESKVFCKLKRKDGKWYKFPKLQELYMKLFWESFEGAHNAMCDVEHTLACLSSLVGKWIIKLKTNDRLSLF